MLRLFFFCVGSRRCHAADCDRRRGSYRIQFSDNKETRCEKRHFRNGPLEIKNRRTRMRMKVKQEKHLAMRTREWNYYVNVSYIHVCTVYGGGFHAQRIRNFITCCSRDYKFTRYTRRQTGLQSIRLFSFLTNLWNANVLVKSGSGTAEASRRLVNHVPNTWLRAAHLSSGNIKGNLKKH